jgi:ketosteroid isomerase-like protein
MSHDVARCAEAGRHENVRDMRAAWFVIAPVLCAASLARAEEDVAALIKRQSQEFSDASASGDGKRLAMYLDDNVVFMNESGEIASKQDLASTTPGPKGVSNHLVQTDVVVQVHGNVAVTSFTDDSTVQFHGQTTHAKYRSTEVWMKKKAGWLMISSQTTAIPADPPAIKLPGKALEEYVGTYKAGNDFVIKIARSGDELTGSANGGKPYPIKVEMPDVLFTPGQPRIRRIFQRDAHGKITAFVARRDGHDITLTRVG